MSNGDPKEAPGALARCVTSLLVLLAVTVGGLANPPAQNRSSQGLYITGQYLYQGGPPPQMAEVFAISLIAHDSMGRNRPLTGYVSTTGGNFRFSAVRLSGDRLTFSTRAIKGISYRFEGRILKVRSDDDVTEIPELEGALIKLRNGERKGQVTGRFKYEEFGD